MPQHRSLFQGTLNHIFLFEAVICRASFKTNHNIGLHVVHHTGHTAFANLLLGGQGCTDGIRECTSMQSTECFHNGGTSDTIIKCLSHKRFMLFVIGTGNIRNDRCTNTDAEGFLYLLCTRRTDINQYIGKIQSLSLLGSIHKVYRLAADNPRNQFAVSVFNEHLIRNDVLHIPAAQRQKPQEPVAFHRLNDEPYLITVRIQHDIYTTLTVSLQIHIQIAHMVLFTRTDFTYLFLCIRNYSIFKTAGSKGIRKFSDSINLFHIVFSSSFLFPIIAENAKEFIRNSYSSSASSVSRPNDFG